MSARPGQESKVMFWPSCWFYLSKDLVRTDAIVPGVAITKIFLAFDLAASLIAGSVPTNFISGYSLRR